MTNSLRRNVLAAVVLGVQVLAQPASAVGPTGQQDSLADFHEQSAPLAFSADGSWRIHVGADKRMYRSRPDAGKPAQSLALPVFARALASSASAERVAFTSGSQCVGVVDFGGAAGQPALSWLPGGMPLASQADGQQAMAAGMPSEASCGWPAAKAIAISSDGRLLATPSQVFDIDRRAVIATLPAATGEIYARAVLRLAFIDNNTRLLVVSATLGEGYESLNMPSNYQIAVWDLANKTLSRLETVDTDGSHPPIIYLAQAALSGGAVYRIDNAAYLASQANWKEGVKPAPLQLVRHRLEVCGGRPEYLAKLAPDRGRNALVDPHGRWIAVVDKASDTRGAQDDNVSVRDIHSGAQIISFRAPAGIRGLLATADGSGIVGLSAVPEKGDGLDRENYGGDPVRFDIPRSKLAPVPAAPRTPASSATCAIEDETPQARQVKRSARLLGPAWSIRLAEFQAVFSGKDDEIWLDRGATISLLDPVTGRDSAQYPTARKENVTFVAAPWSGGYLTYEGDTLAWRAFTPGVRQRLIEKRPGWKVEKVQLQGRAAIAFWQAPENARVPKRFDTRQDIEAVAYDAVTLKPVNRRHLASDEFGMIGDVTDPIYLGAAFPMCTDSLGPMRSGHDWRLSHFDSFRFMSCGPGPSQTRMWSHLDIAPRGARAFQHERAALAHDGPVAVAFDGGQLRVFDTSNRTEIAQISMKDGRKPSAVFVLARHGLILVEAPLEGADQFRSQVTAYALPELPKLGNKK